MLKEHERTISIFQRLADAFMVSVAWFIAFVIRFYYIPGAQGSFITFLKISPILIIITHYFLHSNELYKSYRFSSRYKEVMAIFKANSQAFLTLLILIYFQSPDKISRIVLFIYFFLSHFLLITLRISVRNYLRYLRAQGKNLRHVLLVGNGPQLLNYIETIHRFKDCGVRILGWQDAQDLKVQAYELEIPTFDDSIVTVKKQLKPDVIILGYSGAQSKKVDQVLKTNFNDVVPIQVLPNLPYSFIGHRVEDFAGVPLITMNQPMLGSFDILMKRFFDFTLSLIGLLFLSPLLFMVSILVKLTSKGPILYSQQRMGLDGKEFKMWKFRSMRVDAEKEGGAQWTVEKDPRRTPLGSFLRATSIDELPQLWNVLVGDMSLVGPRPERPIFVEKFKNEVPAYMLRHKMKAGITGWAQINGWRGNTSLEKRIECDIFYIKNWSLWLDVKILFFTLWKGFINKNAY